MRESINYNIFLDCPRNIRFERRLKRDVSERDRNYEDVVNLFKNRLDSMHELYVEPVKKYCDLIIDTSYEADVSEIIKLIKEKYYEK